nr:TIGR00725 family protein [Desulfallas sp. Bu1-1]
MLLIYIGVVGSASCDPETLNLAEAVGEEIAGAGAVLICGGRGGVMEAAARGARKRGGVSIGILPGTARSEGNGELTYALPSGLGNARNAVIACASDVVIAISGGYGTLSEIGLALKMNKPVIGLQTWRAVSPQGDNIPLIPAQNAGEAVRLAVNIAARRMKNEQSTRHGD